MAICFYILIAIPWRTATQYIILQQFWIRSCVFYQKSLLYLSGVYYHFGITLLLGIDSCSKNYFGISILLGINSCSKSYCCLAELGLCWSVAYFWNLDLTSLGLVLLLKSRAEDICPEPSGTNPKRHLTQAEPFVNGFLSNSINLHLLKEYFRELDNAWSRNNSENRNLFASEE